MTKLDILKVFKRFRGSFGWSATKLGVSKGTLSKWLWNQKPIPALDARKAEAEALAAQLVESKGSCMGSDVNGPPVRDALKRLRRKGH